MTIKPDPNSPAEHRKAGTDAAKNPGGRPSKYTPELIEIICERLSRGEPMAAICREDGMPAYRTVKDWMDTKPDVSAAIARARESGEDWLAAECLEIADTPILGEEVELDADGNVSKTRRSDMIQHRKLQIETRLKLLAKWNPKKWGDKLGVGQADGLDPVQSDVTDKASRVAELLAEAGKRGG